MKEILKQSFWLVAAQILTRIIGFFYTIFLAKNLGVSDFGIYSVGLAYFSIVSSISDFGFNRFLVREVAKEKEKSWELIWNVLMIRLTVVAVLFASFAVGVYLLDRDKMRVSVILLSSLSVLPQAIALTFDGIFIALKKLQFSALSAIALSISTTLLGFLLISKGFGVYGAVNALILGQLTYAVTLGLFLYRHQGFSLSKVTFGIIKKAVIGSLPYGILAILGLLYFRIDILILSYIKGNFETGIYGASYKFLEAMVFIPAALSTAIFPVLAKLHDTDKNQVERIYFKSLKVLFLLSLAVVLGYLLVLPTIIQTFLPNYIPAIEVIKILSVAIPFMFCHFPAVQVLLSTDKYLKTVLTFSVILLTLNIFLNLMLIPQYGYVAASWVTVFSEALSFLIYFNFLRIRIFKK